MIKSYCMKDRCTYRKDVGQEKAFCLLPRCPYEASVRMKIKEPNMITRGKIVKTYLLNRELKCDKIKE